MVRPAVNSCRPAQCHGRPALPSSGPGPVPPTLPWGEGDLACTDALRHHRRAGRPPNASLSEIKAARAASRSPPARRFLAVCAVVAEPVPTYRGEHQNFG